MDCSPPGSSVRGIFQARILEWGAIAFSQGDHYTPSNAYMLVKVYTNFDTEWDVLNTEMAIRTKDVVEVIIINNLTIYSKEQRHITFACQKRTEKGLASAVKSDLSSHLEKVI